MLLLLLMNCLNSAEWQIIHYVLVAQWLWCRWIHTCGCCLFCTCDVLGSAVALFHSTVLAPLGSTRLCWLHFMVPLRATSTYVPSLERGGMIANWHHMVSIHWLCKMMYIATGFKREVMEDDMKALIICILPFPQQGVPKLFTKRQKMVVKMEKGPLKT